jgi:hypothetical protein
LQDLVNHHQLLLLKPMWKVANDYFINHRNLARRMQVGRGAAAAAAAAAGIRLGIVTEPKAAV